MARVQHLEGFTEAVMGTVANWRGLGPETLATALAVMGADTSATITADNVVVDPSVQGAIDVQDVLAALDANKSAIGHVHAASVITFTPAGTISSTDVQAALSELDTDKSAIGHGHSIADVAGLQGALDAKVPAGTVYAASAVTNVPAGTITGTTVQAALNQLDTNKSAVGHTHAASAIGVTPSGGISSTNVGAALAELDTKKSAVGHGHAIADVAGLQTALDAKLPVGTTYSASGILLANGDTVEQEFGATKRQANLATDLATPTAAAAVLAVQGDLTGGLDGAQTDDTPAEAFRDSVSFIRFVPKSLRAAVRSGTSTVDMAAYLRKAAASKRKISFPAGQYPFASAINGWLDGTEWVFSRGAKLLKMANCHGLLFDTSVDNISIVGMEMDGQRTTYTSTSFNAVYVPTTAASITNLNIERCNIHDTVGAGIMVLGASGKTRDEISIARNKLANIGYHAIICQDYVNNTFITENRVNGYSLDVIDAVGITTGRNGSVHLVRGNRVAATTFKTGSSQCHGISLDDAVDAVISENIVKGALGYSIEIAYSTGVQVLGNRVTDGSRGGIVVDGNALTTSYCLDVTVAGNTVSRCLCGIYVFMGNADGVTKHKNINISGNTLSASTGSGSPRSGAYISDVSQGSVANIYNDNVDSGLVIANTCDDIFVADNFAADNNGAASGSFAGIQVYAVSTRLGSVNGIVMGLNHCRTNGNADIQTFFDTFLTNFPNTNQVRLGSTLVPVRINTPFGHPTVTSSFLANFASITAQRQIRNPTVVASATGTVTPALNTDGYLVYTATGNLTIASPTGATVGQDFIIEIIQDGTGGRTVGWSSVFKFNTAWSDAGNSAGKRSQTRWHCSASSVYLQIGTQTPYV